MIKNVFEKQTESSQNLIVDLKTQFEFYVKERNSQTLKLNYLTLKTTCRKFEDLYMFAKEQCSQNEYLTNMMQGDGGPLKSYFQVMDLKIQVSLKLALIQANRVENRKND